MCHSFIHLIHLSCPFHNPVFKIWIKYMFYLKEVKKIRTVGSVDLNKWMYISESNPIWDFSGFGFSLILFILQQISNNKDFSIQWNFFLLRENSILRFPLFFFKIKQNMQQVAIKFQLTKCKNTPNLHLPKINSLKSNFTSLTMTTVFMTYFWCHIPLSYHCQLAPGI